LLRYCDAVVRRSADLAARRNAVLNELGEAATIDAAATIANYQRMVRIADGTGIPLDAFTMKSSEPWRDRLGINSFRSRGNTFS